ncbi:glycoside hydrolase family 3 C-terminal domain-containing protein [Catenulispora pinisilvae]|uniref:glycoside hydrolase family 3 C-terminal domain-containing protein n=1 Tax=Catenulispora pinisilvae TaxID=2705253 RepID=UPI001890DC89|nr:glycoside hydrolase family 3 C-terminal domain-containing protein [Catenulispora pinisilvae]
MQSRALRRRGLIATCAISLAASIAPAVVHSAAASTAASGPVPVYRDTHHTFAERAADLVSRMTFPEKVAQLNDMVAPAIPRLGVQQYNYDNEAAHGVAYLGTTQYNDAHGTNHPYATSFPVDFASTMSWDPSLMYQETTAMSDEARGLLDKSLFGVSENNLGPSASDYGYLTYWAPNVNMDRDPRWGRNNEAFGEDPYLVGQMAGAFVNGFQGNDPNGKPLSPYLKAAATAKHYAVHSEEDTPDGVPDGRWGNNSVVSETNLRDYYTAQFGDLIENSHIAGLMTSYNAINGTPSTADTYTTNLLAGRTYGFDGYTTSDCGAIGTIYGVGPHSGHDWAPPGWTTDGTDWTETATGTKVPVQAGAIAMALRSGTIMNCGGPETTLANVQAAITAGLLSVGVIDADLVKVFTVRMATGEFDPPSSVGYTKIGKAQVESPAHQQLAKAVADNSLVLLQNNKVPGSTAPLLPANPAKLNHVVVLGDLANTVNLGGYSSSPTYTTSPLQGITAAVHAVNPSATITYDAAGTSSTSNAPVTLSAATQQAIKNADLVVTLIGTTTANEQEGTDRLSLAIPGDYRSLISAVDAVGNPKTALVIQGDGPLTLDDGTATTKSVLATDPAILFSGYNGQAQGTALADVLFGKQNPSGHLNFTWYKNDSQLPAADDYGLAPADTGGLGRTYQYFTGAPTFPFGYGLSYSNFAYSHLSIDHSAPTADDTVKATFTVTNTGSAAGATVAQLYAASPTGAANMPIKRLVGFQKTKVLAPGAAQTITIPVKISDLALWNATADKMEVTDGAYGFQIGSDAAAVKLSAPVTVSGAMAQDVKYVTVQPAGVVYHAGDTIDLTAKNPWLKDDSGQNPAVVADGVVEAVNNDQSFADLSEQTVTYASSNPRVATVSPAGVVTAASDGVATITVTVKDANGKSASGSAPFVVQGGFTVSAPPAIAAGGSVTATANYTNHTSANATNVALDLFVPSGWKATSTTPTAFASIAPGHSVQSQWTVTAPTGAAPGAMDLSAQLSVGRIATESVAATVDVAYASQAAAFSNVGISDDASPSSANLDGGGLSLSAQALAGAGLTPGKPFTHNGVTFTWPAVQAGQNDNIVANGQTVPVSGAGSTLGILGTADNGTAGGTGTIVYADGTSQPFSLTFGDWWASAAPGTDIAATTPYINATTGKMNQAVNLYYQGIPLAAGKTVQYLVLPTVSATASKGASAMHVFAMAVS